LAARVASVLMAAMAGFSRLTSADRANVALCAVCVGFVGLAGCASVPEVGPIPSAERPQVVGASDPPSSDQVTALVAHPANEPGDTALLRHHIAIEQAVAESPLVAGETTRLLRDGPTTLRATFAAIRSAKHQINLEYYIMEDVESDGTHLSDLLVAKRREGVAVNVIYDSVGSFSTPNAFFVRLKQAGVNLVEYNPVNPFKAKARFSVNHRDHRKILVVDGASGIVGGVNLDVGHEVAPACGSQDISGEPTEPTRDADLQIDGPVVAQLQTLFLDHWREQHGRPIDDLNWFPVIPPEGDKMVRIIGSSPGRAGPRYYVTLISHLRSAEKSIIVEAAFFVPTHDEVKALKEAARRGVDVRLLVPDHGGSKLSIAVGRSRYGELLKAGVKIYETRGVVLHSKTVTIDGVWSVIGSSNFDHRSVIFNDEVDSVVLGGDTAQGLQAIFEADRATAHPIDHKTWSRRPVTAKLEELYARVWQNWL
jgi:cardiolipin synthase